MKVLIVDDDATTRLIIKKTVENEGYKVLEAKNGYEGLKIFQKEKNHIYLAILDWIMPEMNGIELCQRIRKVATSHYVYLLFLTSKRDIKNIVEGLETGGDDYMTKPFAKTELAARIMVARRFINLEQKLNTANKKLEILATTDSLTGLLNRRELFSCLEDELYRSSREKTPYSLIMIDIDYFKAINDTFGHIAGDRALIEVADRIKLELRPYDIIGRYGGEEFLIGAPGADTETGKNIAERIRTVISDKQFQINDTSMDITISIGITSRISSGNKKEMPHLLDAMIEEADIALYQAKERGRNRIETYE